MPRERVLALILAGGEGGWQRGNADAIYRHRRFLREFDPDIVVVLSSDHICKLDFGDVIARHHERRADVTLVTTRVPLDQAGRFGTVQVADDGRITDFAYKPDQPRSPIVTTEVFVYTADTLLDTIDALAANSGDDNSGLKDWGDELLPRLVHAGRAFHYPLDGYWRDIGTIPAYWQSHMGLLEDQPPIDLDDPRWPILTIGIQRLPARIDGSARIDRSLIAPGCTIRGEVARAVLGPGVVERGAIVRDAVVFENTTIAAGARIERAIVDSHVEIGAGACIGLDQIADQRITLIGQRARIAANTRIAAGERVLPIPAEPANRSGRF